jgi:hypothetical protein
MHVHVYMLGMLWPDSQAGVSPQLSTTAIQWSVRVVLAEPALESHPKTRLSLTGLEFLDAELGVRDLDVSPESLEQLVVCHLRNRKAISRGASAIGHLVSPVFIL